jgi:hypothetical protein
MLNLPDTHIHTHTGPLSIRPALDSFAIAAIIQYHKFRTGGVPQVVDSRLCKHEALSSNSSPTQKSIP